MSRHSFGVAPPPRGGGSRYPSFDLGIGGISPPFSFSDVVVFPAVDADPVLDAVFTKIQPAVAHFWVGVKIVDRLGFQASPALLHAHVELLWGAEIPSPEAN